MFFICLKHGIVFLLFLTMGFYLPGARVDGHCNSIATHYVYHSTPQARARTGLLNQQKGTKPMNEQTFNRMLSAPEYRERYKPRCGQDGIWEIPCQHGDIEPYSLTELCCYVSRAFSVGKFIAGLPAYCTVTQSGQSDAVFKFPISKLDEVADIVHARRRRKVSPEQKAAMVARLQPFLFKSHAGENDIISLKEQFAG
jgi:hypothetical protein